VFGALSDRSAPAQVIRERAVRLAVKEAGQAGGLDGRPVGVVLCNVAARAELDNLTRTEAAVASAGFLARTLGVPAIVGPSASADAQQVWEAVRPAGTLVISPAATSPTFADLEPAGSDERPGLLWRTAPSDALQGPLMADDMLARDVRAAVVIRETGAYGEGLASVFSKRFTGAGGTVQLLSISGEADIAAVLPRAAAERAPEILFVSSQQAWVTRFLELAATNQALADRGIFLTEAAANQAVFDGAAPAAAALFPRVRGTRPSARDPNDYVFASFLANYRTEYGGQDPSAATFSAHAYDAAWLVLYGAAWSLFAERAVTGAGIARGLRRVSAGAGAPAAPAATPIIPASWPAVVAAFRARRAIEVSGASGELDFHPQSREVGGPMEIWTITSNNGRHTITRAAGPPPTPGHQEGPP
jgi:ABC-type branched-subunit amino acid transport system substrate-binding protein